MPTIRLNQRPCIDRINAVQDIDHEYFIDDNMILAKVIRNFATVHLRSSISNKINDILVNHLNSFSITFLKCPKLEFDITSDELGMEISPNEINEVCNTYKNFGILVHVDMIPCNDKLDVATYSFTVTMGEESLKALTDFYREIENTVNKKDVLEKSKLVQPSLTSLTTNSKTIARGGTY